MKHRLLFLFLIITSSTNAGVWQLGISGTTSFSNFSSTEPFPDYFPADFQSATSYGGGAELIVSVKSAE